MYLNQPLVMQHLCGLGGPWGNVLSLLKIVILEDTKVMDLCTPRTAARLMPELQYHWCGAVQACMGSSSILRFKSLIFH